MNRGLLLGLLVFFALLGISLIGGDNLGSGGERLPRLRGGRRLYGAYACGGMVACRGVPCGGVVVNCGCSGVVYQQSYAPAYCGGCAGNACGGAVACGGVVRHRCRLFGRMCRNDCACAGAYPVMDTCGCAGYTVGMPVQVIGGPVQKMGPVKKWDRYRKWGRCRRGCGTEGRRLPEGDCGGPAVCLLPTELPPLVDPVPVFYVRVLG